MTTVSSNPAVAGTGDLLDQMTLKAAVANSQRYAAEGDRTILSEIAATAAGFFYVPTKGLSQNKRLGRKDSAMR
jgi:hypothetical protein